MEHNLTGLQLSVMQALWRRGEATVVDVQEDLSSERRLAQSTVATLLSRLERRGLIAHRTEGRQFLYRALVTEQEVRRSAVEGIREFADDLFRGDVVALVSHLLTASDVDPADLARVKALIEAKERELKGERS